MKDHLVFLGIGVLAIVALAVALVFIPWFYIQVPAYKALCLDYGKQTDQEVKLTRPNWSSVSCYVNTPTGWQERDQIKFNNSESK